MSNTVPPIKVPSANLGQTDFIKALSQMGMDIPATDIPGQYSAMAGMQESMPSYTPNPAVNTGVVTNPTSFKAPVPSQVNVGNTVPQVTAGVNKVDVNGFTRTADGGYAIDGKEFKSMSEYADYAKAQKSMSDMGTSFAEYAGAASAGLGAITGVASYFDNKKMNSKRMDAMDTNIAIAKEEQAHRKDFRGSTKSAFA